MDNDSTASIDRFMRQAQTEKAKYMRYSNYVEEEPAMISTKQRSFLQEIENSQERAIAMYESKLIDQPQLMPAKKETPIKKK
jgi:hypothetical protein